MVGWCINRRAAGFIPAHACAGASPAARLGFYTARSSAAIATACPAGHNYGIMSTESDRLPGAAFYDNFDEISQNMTKFALWDGLNPSGTPSGGSPGARPPPGGG